LKPRACSSAPSDAAERPLPREETTPPVIKMNRVMDFHCRDDSAAAQSKATPAKTSRASRGAKNLRAETTPLLSRGQRPPIDGTRPLPSNTTPFLSSEERPSPPGAGGTTRSIARRDRTRRGQPGRAAGRVVEGVISDARILGERHPRAATPPPANAPRCRLPLKGGGAFIVDASALAQALSALALELSKRRCCFRLRSAPQPTPRPSSQEKNAPPR
jgi:hypothetical protein